ncbi:cell division protein ZapA, partial [Paracoccus sp. PXZ]
MAEVDFTIGHKSYTLACQEGEERLLKRAAGLLDAEARVILEQAGRMPEPRLLLLSGLMLADR